MGDTVRLATSGCGLVMLLILGVQTSAAPRPEVVPEGWVPPEIHCPAGKAPTLDGVVAEGEWDDALTKRKANDPLPHDTMVQKLNVTYDPADLSCTVRMKHDGERLYILCEIVDNLLYNLDTEEWAPMTYTNRAKPYWKSPEGQEDWGYWGDCFEVGLCAKTNGGYRYFPVTGPAETNKPAECWAECWKVQGNISYGRVMAGSLLQKWVDSGAMKCAMKRGEKGKGYT